MGVVVLIFGENVQKMKIKVEIHTEVDLEVIPEEVEGA